uniref:Centromere protein X n=1 Tax=Heterorhabditis bacteriophora TaxID=37862 RepID=A0A1I7X7F0_HETBA
MTISELAKYQRFLDDTLRPDYLRAIEDRERYLNDRHEYELLLVAINKIQCAGCSSVNMRVNLGHHVFVNAEIDNCNTVIVKMVGDLYAELPLPRAVIFIEEKIKWCNTCDFFLIIFQFLNKKASQADELASKIRAHIDHIKDSAVRSLFKVGCRGKRKAGINPDALCMLTTLCNLLIKETLVRAACCARNSDKKTVKVEHLQRVLAQIMLDFST